MMSPAPAGARYLTIDHWRGFAALWVLVFHANRGRTDLAPDWLGGLITHGWLGVQMFFVISGYCIAERVAREQRTGGSTLSFMRDRLLRVYPPYWAALLVAMVLNVAGALVKGVPLSAPFVFPDGAIGWFAAGTAIEFWLGQPTFLLVAWTLTCEIGFYICAAAGLALSQLTGRPWLGAAWWTVLLFVGLVPALNSYIPLLMLWPQFALGGIVWLAWHQAGSTAARLFRGSAGIAVIWFASWGQPAEIASPLRFGCGCAWVLLVLRPWDLRLAASPLLRWLGWTGAFSYSLYLLHVPIVGKLGNLIERWPPLSGQPLLLVALTSACALPCAWLFYRLIELPSEAFRKRVARQPGMKSAAAKPDASAL